LILGENCDHQKLIAKIDFFPQASKISNIIRCHEYKEKQKYFFDCFRFSELQTYQRKAYKFNMKKNLTLKMEVTQLSNYANFARSLNMSRSEMVRTAIAEFVEKQKTSQAA